MHTSSNLCFAFVLVVGCGGNGVDSARDGGGDGGDGRDSGVIDAPPRGFQIRSADIVLGPGDAKTYCYYFRTPNTEPMAIRKWQSSMTPGTSRMIMFTTRSDFGTPGTVSAENCKFVEHSDFTRWPAWTYAADRLESAVELPGDDGEGKPLARVIQPNTPGYLRMQFHNTTAQPLTVHVTLNAEALEAGAAYTATTTYMTHNAALSIRPTISNGGVPSVANGGVATKTCNPPTDTKFWMISTHARKQSIKTEVQSGTSASTEVVFTSEDWEHPIPRIWPSVPFYRFNDATGPNQLTFTCTYVNNSNQIITVGDSDVLDETCIAIGQLFPAAEPTVCACGNLGCLNVQF